MDVQHIYRRSLLGILAATALAVFLPGAARAADDTVTEDLTAAQAEGILKDFEVEFEELDNGAYLFEVDGLRMIFFNKGKTLQMYSVFKDVRVTLSRVNEWNKKMRFTKAYLDDDNDPALECDLELTGGVTIKNVKEWIKTYVASLQKFKEHIEE